MKWVRWAVAVAVSAAGLWFAFRGVHWGEVGEALRGVRSPGWLLGMPLVLLIEFSVRTLRWKILLNPLKSVPFPRLFPITAGGFFLNMVLPFRAGEFARVYWTSRKAQVPVSSAAAVLAADRLLDMMSLLIFVCFILARRTSLIPASGVLWTFIAVTLGGMAALVLLAHHPGLFRRLLGRLRLPARPAAWADQFVEGVSALGRGHSVLALIGISLFFWVVDIAYFRLIGWVFGMSLSWTDGAFVLVSLCFGALLPSAPGFVGTFEAAGVAGLALLGYDKSLALSLVLTMHALMIAANALLGIPSLLLGKLTVPHKDENALSATPSRRA